MRILGIDPGYGRLGIAVIDAEKGKKEILVHSECFETDKKMPHPERLLAVRAKIADNIGDFRPDFAALETLMFSKNKKTAIGVAEARGAVLSEISSRKIPIKEYNPGTIKVAITGHGKSDKRQVKKMIEIMLSGKINKARDDEYDAIAVALTAAAIERQ